jgi:hypothetical protein
MCDEKTESSTIEDQSTPDEPVYIKTERTVIDYKYNPKYGDNRICKCGHSYYRHFDSYEDMEACGCKYCNCKEFSEAV